VRERAIQIANTTTATALISIGFDAAAGLRSGTSQRDADVQASTRSKNGVTLPSRDVRWHRTEQPKL
jgi:hypothetical protein